MADRPDKKPRWATVPTVNPTTGKNNVIEPSEGKKDLGWDYIEKPARNFMNWVMNKAYEWIDYFDKNTKFLVLENDPVPDLSFKLQGGTYFSQGTTLVTIADATLGPLTAPSSDPRIDRVVLNKLTGVVSITTGVENASPVPIALLDNEISLSQIVMVVSQTQIFNADITDERPLWDTVLAASLLDAGVSEASTDAEAIAKSDTDRHLTPSNLAALDSSLTFKGLIEKSTDAEAIAKSDTDRAITPSNLAALIPSQTVKGLIEIATQSEVNAGTDDIRYVTPLKLKVLRTGGSVQEVFIQDGAVATGIVLTPFDDTIPQNDEGDEYIALSITPKNSTNVLKIEVSIVLASNTVGTIITAALYQDSISDSLVAIGRQVHNVDKHDILNLVWWMIAGTTSAIAFKVRAGGSIAGTTTFNGVGGARVYGGVSGSSMSITEYNP